MNCPFCKIFQNRKDEIIRESKYTFTILSNPRLMAGHLLVIPNQHINRLTELTADERADFFNEVIVVQELILNKYSSGCDVSQHFRPFIPEGKLKVGHLHMHIRPRELNDELYQKVQINEVNVFHKKDSGKDEKFRKLLM